MPKFTLRRLYSAFTKTSKGFARNEGGHMALMTAIGSVAIIGSVALAIDMTRGINKQINLADASDIVALQLAKSGLESDADLMAAAQSHLAQLYPGAEGDNLRILSIEKDGDEVTVRLADQSQAALSGILGRGDLDVSARSSAIYSEQNIDIALVLDTTGSMRDLTTGSSETKMQALQRAASSLVDTVSNQNPDNVRMSVVPFAQHVNVGTQAAAEGWVRVDGPGFAGCVGSRSQPFDIRVEYSGNRIPADLTRRCGAELQPLTNDFDDVNSTIASLNPSGWTYIPSGLAWGWRTLNARSPLAPTDVGAEKIIILMTDGANTRSKIGETHDGWSQGAADARTRRLCDAVKRDDVTIYSIAYEVDDTATQNLLRNCATDTTFFFNARNADDLEGAFSAIGDSVEQLRITA